MKRINPVYFFVVLFAFLLVLGIAAMLILVNSSYIFLFGFLLLLVVILGTTSIALSNGTLEKRTTIYIECIECNKEIDINSDFCKHCGAGQQHTVICEFCGEQNTEEVTVCKHCNALLK